MSHAGVAMELAERVKALEASRILKVAIRHQYGSERIYPLTHEGKVFAAMLGQKTLCRVDIDCIKALGFTVEVVAEPVAL